MLSEGKFDLVLSDWRMAEMNGLELLRAIKEQYPDLTVILMTAYGTIDNAGAALADQQDSGRDQRGTLGRPQNRRHPGVERPQQRTHIRQYRSFFF